MVTVRVFISVVTKLVLGLDGMGEAICIVVVVQVPRVSIVVVVAVILRVVIVVVIVIITVQLITVDVVFELLLVFLSMLSSLLSQALFKVVALAGVSCRVFWLWNRLEFWLVVGILSCVFRIRFPNHLLVLGAHASHLLKHSVFFLLRFFGRMGILGLGSRREGSLVGWIGFPLLLLSEHPFLIDLVEERSVFELVLSGFSALRSLTRRRLPLWSLGQRSALLFALLLFSIVQLFLVLLGHRSRLVGRWRQGLVVGVFPFLLKHFLLFSQSLLLHVGHHVEHFVV